MCFNNSVTMSKYGVNKLKRSKTPILITCSYIDKMNNFKSFYSLINKKYVSNLDYAILDLWIRFFLIIEDNVIIFTHNLGDFDGYFIYKAILNIYQNNPNSFETIIIEKKRIYPNLIKKWISNYFI